MLEFKKVSFRYPSDEEETIKGLSFKAKKGEFISIIGASGCGKSTLLRLINKLEKLQKGSILVDGGDIDGLKNYSGYMPQKDLLFPWLTIEKNLFLPMELQGYKQGEMEKRAEAILKEMGLWAYKNKFPKALSGGMRQRISFARTLLTESDLLLLDEPFSALDSLTKLELQEWLLSLWGKHNKTILFITHDVEEAIFLSQRIFVIEDYPVTQFREYQVPLSYPRNREDLKENQLIELKEELIGKLRKKVTI